MNQAKLSFCIATRNRGAFIGETLESIACQATDEVEVVILDGASTDDTGEVVRRYQERLPRLRYHRQEAAMGIDRDFANAVDMALGEYCWLFSDDDLLMPGAIRTMLDAMKEDYELILVNSEVRNADFSRVLRPTLAHLETRTYTPSEHQLLFAGAGKGLTFVGGVIIKRRLWNKREKERYFGTYFVHFGVIFQEPLPGNARVIGEPLVAIRYGNASWVSKSFEIWMFKWPGLVWSFHDLPDSVKSQVCSKEPWRSPARLFQLRAKGTYTHKDYADWLEPRLGSGRDRVLSKMCAHFPGRLANLLAFIYYFAAGGPSSHLISLLDLANSPFCFWKLPVTNSTPSEERVAAIPSSSKRPSSPGTGNGRSLDI